MNTANLRLAEDIISKAYVDQAVQARNTQENLVKSLLTQRCIPEKGWSDETIELVLHEISMMDSNNFQGNVGVGEREARVFSPLVSRRHYGLCHGVGRSGELAAVQPKAAGSSLLMKLTNNMALHAIKLSGCHAAKACLVVPTATGMGIVLSLLTLGKTRPGAKYVLWPRIDQKTCFKAISTAGFIPVVIEPILVGDEVRTDLEEVERQIAALGPDNILCVLSTTSCFAPRTPDRIDELARMCAQHDIGHIVNNAYGLQSSKCMQLLVTACKQGRVDCFVQSTDKNFMVPVGGSIIAGPSKAFIEAVSTLYPGRASNTPILDLFITLLSMGVEGYKKLLADRKVCYKALRAKLAELAEPFGERVLDTPRNDVSIGVSISNITEGASAPTVLGSMLFSRLVSGIRTVDVNGKKTVEGVEFAGYGSHISGYPVHYMTAAAAIGMTQDDVEVFAARFVKTVGELRKQIEKQRKRQRRMDEDAGGAEEHSGAAAAASPAGE